LQAREGGREILPPAPSLAGTGRDLIGCRQGKGFNWLQAREGI